MSSCVNNYITTFNYSKAKKSLILHLQSCRNQVTSAEFKNYITTLNYSKAIKLNIAG